jgi:uncharacterized protein with PIN domain
MKEQAESSSERRFICDRMVGSLCRHLRLMGYDTLSANDLPPGNRKEDTGLLTTAREENRIILTRDAEFSRRDDRYVKLLTGRTVMDQVRNLIQDDLIVPMLRLTRCSVCNSPLVLLPDNVKEEEVPDDCITKNIPVMWCMKCKKAYWEGSHTSRMRATLALIVQERDEDPMRIQDR